MELKTAPALNVTSLLDRSGRRIGSYLIEASKDSLNREKRDSPTFRDTNAVIIKDLTTAQADPLEPEVTPAVKGSSLLDISA